MPEKASWILSFGRAARGLTCKSGRAPCQVLARALPLRRLPLNVHTALAHIIPYFVVRVHAHASTSLSTTAEMMTGDSSSVGIRCRDSPFSVAKANERKLRRRGH